ncbi:hypothetical protein OIU77_025338 [Salix suchowensis]|uniref:Uncharacterized protein n=1 Tax=Salix suchowensis TaxID=1278906 RepID=A0ABQ9BYT2_9ROSI|nr:hypothetical protein OIU77_025338 [Salix suchowensis]
MWVTSFHAFLLKQIRNLWILRWDPEKNLTAEQFLIASMAIETEFLSLQAGFYMVRYSYGGSFISLRKKELVGPILTSLAT